MMKMITESLSKVYLRIVGIEVLKIIAGLVLMVALSVAVFSMLPGFGFFDLAVEGNEQVFSEAVLGDELFPWAGFVVSILIFFFLAVVLTIIDALAKVAVVVRDVSLGKAVAFAVVSWYKVLPLVMITTLLILAGSVLFILPGIYLAIRLGFVLFVWFENQGERAWLIVKKSFALASGEVFWTLFLIIFLTVVAGMIVNTILGGVPLIGWVLSSSVSVAVIVPINISALYALYEIAKKSGEGSVKKR